MAAKPAKRPAARKRSVDYNLEKPPLTTGSSPEDETSTLRSLGRWKHWDIRHWSFPAVLLMLIVLIVAVILVLELFGVRFLTPWIERWFEQG